MTTSTALRVSLDSLDAASVAVHRTVLASLPRRFVVTDGGPAEVTVVCGRNPDWLDLVARAVSGGARGVILIRPGLADADRVRALSAAVAGRAVVAVDTPYANDQTWTAARHEIAADAREASIVDSVVAVTGGDPAGALIDQLAVVAALVDVRGLRLIHRTAAGYLVAGPAGGTWVTLAGVTSGAVGAGLAVDVVAADRRWQVRFDGRAAAIPTEVTLHDLTGTHARSLTYESGHRAIWRHLHEAITGNGTVAWSLDGLADTLAVAGRLLGQPEGART